VLTPEAAKSHLEQWQVGEEDDRLPKGVGRLTAPLRAVAYGLLGRDERGESLDYQKWDERQRRLREAGHRLDQLPRKDRCKIFGAVALQLAEALDATWEFLRRTPYERGYMRKAFRAPNHPEATAESRAVWMNQMLELLGHIREDVPNVLWLAAWAPHLESMPAGGGAPDVAGRLLAAVIDGGGPEGEEVFKILCQSLRNEHPIGGMGRHVTRAMLLAARPDGWELIEKTLLAAQRQEGLRQAILEAVDEAHPEAFRRMLRLIRDHDLARFSAVVRAVDVWLGYGWDVVKAKVVNDTIDRLLTLFDDPGARRKAVEGSDGEAVYLGLWATAFEDAFVVLPIGEKLLRHAKVEVRFAAATVLGQLGLTQAQASLLPALEDEDLRVAFTALSGICGGDDGDTPKFAEDNDLFERLERLFARLPAQPVQLKPLVWPWTERRAGRQQVAAALIAALGQRPATRLIPYLKVFDPWQRRSVVEQLAKEKKWDELTRDTLFALAGDTSDYVRKAALEALAKVRLKPGEAERLEGYLTRKAGDLRRGVVEVLIGQSDEAALASADRLLSAKDGNQRLAGLEVLRQLSEAGRVGDACRGQAEAYGTSRARLTREEQTQLDAIAYSGREVVTLDNALGLMNPAERSPVVAPVKRKVPLITPAAVACLKSLDDLVHQHRDTPVMIPSGNREEERLLGTLEWGFPSPRYVKSREQEAERLPLRSVWQEWLDERPASLRDRDGLELVRAAVWVTLSPSYQANWWNEWAKKSAARKAAAAAIAGGQAPVKLRYERIVTELLDWLLYVAPPDAVDYLLDAVEMSFVLVPPEEMKRLGERPEKAANQGFLMEYLDLDWRNAEVFQLWLHAFSQHLGRSGAKLTPPQAKRYWQLLHWHDEPFPSAVRSRPDWSVLAAAYGAGEATLADVADDLLGPRSLDHWGQTAFHSLARLTERKLAKQDEEFCGQHPEVRELVERCRARILEVELARGEAATAATPAAEALQSLWSADTLLRILTALGKMGFRGSGREPTLTHLARITFPKPEDTPEEFAQRMRAAIAEGQFPEERLLELSFIAPQWVNFVEQFVGWAGYSEALYWFLAHMRSWGLTELAAVGAGVEEEEEVGAEDAEDEDDEENATDRQPKLSAWERLILERTPLSDSERGAGAIDVAWFRRTYEQLGGKRWQALADTAKFAAGSNQARKAKLIAEVLLGKASRKELLDGVKKKRLKEYVRLLGLLPLAGGAKRDADLGERFRVLQDYRRYAGQLSSMSKPDALRAVEIGLQNLAATVGYPDPLRLEWAMGAEDVKDLAAGPVTVTKDGVTVTLALDEGLQPQLTVRRGDKELKSIPPPLKKDKKLAALVERCTDLRRQTSRMRQSLETAMCRGDTFSGAELVQLCGHALLAPLLERLILIGDGGLGYPDRQGRALRDHRGRMVPVKPGDQLRIAHPHDLLQAGTWDQWQHECFRAERLQPFKQVFRELYVVTRQEQRDSTISRRYAGQQVQEKQAYALWGQRGWNTRDGVFKTFHELGLTATVCFNYGVTTPLEVEGLTIEGVSFSRRDEWQPMKLTEVPSRVFSEVMRDLDLVVSVAHVGGVDPEASASTVEMRTRLLQETCTLLRLTNVQLKNAHAVIDGQLAHYSVHLGSGTVHRLPGGALCVVPVHAQHRGRLFLPFADDDPKTAEVLAKVLLLARDQEIQDPTILEQIRR
jgi:HEAT repeat protein